MAPPVMIKVFSDKSCLILYETFLIFFGIIIIIQSFKPRIKSVIEFIFIGVIRIIINLVMTSVFKPYKCKAGIVLVLLIILF